MLNKKGNVSVEKIKLVEEAARRLGYRMNYKARSLRSGVSNTIALVIPDLNSKEYVHLFMAIHSFFKEREYFVEVYTTSGIVEEELDLLAKIAEKRCMAVFTVSSLNDASSYYKVLDLDENKIVFINRKPKNAKKYISFDFQKAGSEFAEKLSPSQQTVAIFAHEHEKDIVQQFLAGFCQNFARDRVHIFYFNKRNVVLEAYKISATQSLDCFITFNFEDARVLRKAFMNHSSGEMPNIYCLTNNESDDLERSMHIYHLNYYGLGLHAANLIYKNLEEDQKVPEHETFHNDGFTYTFKRKEREVLLKILTVHTPATEALRYLARQFHKKTNIRIEIDSKSFLEVVDIIHSDDYLKYDAIRLDIALFPWFAEKLFMPLDGLNSRLDQLIGKRKKIIDTFNLRINGKTYGVPFDPSVQMLFYRKDLFENQIIQKLYSKKYKEPLKVPETYDELIKVARFFKEQKESFVEVEHGISLMVQNPILIAAEFLCCYYSLGGTITDQGSSLKFDEDILIEAIKKYGELFTVARKEGSDWWSGAIDSYVSGKTAMIIGFVNHLSTIANSKYGRQTGFTHVPGQKPLLGGGVIGIVRDHDKADAVSDFIMWYNDYPVAKEIVKLGGFSSNHSVFDEKEIHEVLPWLVNVKEVMKTGIRTTRTPEGNPINTQLLEKLIGTVIQRNMDKFRYPSFIVNDLNKELSNHYEQLIMKHGAMNIRS